MVDLAAIGWNADIPPHRLSAAFDPQATSSATGNARTSSLASRAQGADPFQLAGYARFGNNCGRILRMAAHHLRAYGVSAPTSSAACHAQLAGPHGAAREAILVCLARTPRILGLLERHHADGHTEPILKIATGFMAAKQLFAASEIGLFEALADGPAGLEELAGKTAFPARTVGIVAAAMVSLGLIDQEGGRYRNGEAAATFLAGKPGHDVRPVLRFFDSICIRFGKSCRRCTQR